MSVEFDSIISDLSFQSSKSLANQLYDRIRKMIISDELPAGFLFPNESELCEKLGIGRTTLREAYKALEANGYIIRSKRGTFVNDSDKVAVSLPFSVALEESDYNDLIEFRALFESQIAGLAAERATADQIDNLRHYYRKMCEHQDNVSKLTYYDAKFHMELAACSGNKLLYRLMLATGDVFISGVYKAFTIDTSENIKQALLSHEEILYAVAHHKRKSAQKAMFDHLHVIKNRGAGQSDL